MAEEIREETRLNPRPDARLAALGDIFRDRNGAYGDTFFRFGRVMEAAFPDGVTVKTAKDWNRLAVLMHVFDKQLRYSNQFATGGHPDSLDDVSIYSQILRHVDQEP